MNLRDTSLLTALLKIQGRDKLLLLIAFFSGACSMGIEIAASRVLAPVFGTSIYVWGALIGVLLGAMSIGYFLGGYIIDKNPNKIILFEILFLGSILALITMVMPQLITNITSLFGLVTGAILSSIILFSSPMLLLAMVPPVVIRLSAENIDNIGKYSGRVYMISTIGSIVGTFLTAFFMIPTFGTRITFISISILLFLISIIYIPRKIYLFFVLMILLFEIAIMAFIVPQAKPVDVLYSTESEYNVIKVLDLDSSRYLKLNSERYVQAVFYPNNPLTGGYWDYVNLGLFFNNPKKALFLGVAGGTSIRQFLKYSNITIDAVEIDSKVIYVAKKYFNIRESDRLHIYVEDGRTFLTNSRDKYDIISVDVFSGGPDIPFHMTTKEFFQLVNERLTDDGMVIMNVLSLKNYTKITNSIANTMLTTFGSVYIIDLGNNQIVIGFKKNILPYEFSSTLQNVRGDLEIVANKSLLNFRKFEPTDDIIFTDDISPVERMSFEMVS